MVAWKATFLHPQAGLVVVEQGDVDVEDIIVFAVDEILHEGSKKAQIEAQKVLDGAVEVIKMYK